MAKQEQRVFNMDAEQLADIASAYQDAVKMADMLLEEKSPVDKTTMAQHFMTSLHFYERIVPVEVHNYLLTGTNRGPSIEFAKIRAKSILEKKV